MSAELKFFLDEVDRIMADETGVEGRYERLVDLVRDTRSAMAVDGGRYMLLLEPIAPTAADEDEGSVVEQEIEASDVDDARRKGEVLCLICYPRLKVGGVGGEGVILR